MKALFTLLFLAAAAPIAAQDVWSLEYHRGLNDRQRGDLTVTLYGTRVFSHGFKEPAETFFEDRIPASAKVELVYEITETPGTVWGSNPSGEDVPETPARIGLILWRDWTTNYGRWFSVQRLDISPGIHRLVVPVEPWAWKSVFGKIGNQDATTREKWRRTWNGPARIGVVGGGYFHAHGIEVLEGVGTLKVLALRVRP